MIARRLRQEEAGFTLVEVLVAATILVLGIGATLTALSGARGLTVKSERVDQGVAIAQREVERMRSLPFASIGTTTVPTTTSGQPILGLLVSSGSVLQLEVAVPHHYESLVPATSSGLPRTSCIAPASVPDSTACPTADRVSSGPTRGTITRYVTYVANCLQVVVTDVCASVGASAQQAKRVTVVVALDDLAGKSSAPIRTETVVAAP